MTDPIYTADNCRDPAYQLNWSYSLFWDQAPSADPVWLKPLQEACEPDGIRVLQHEFTAENVSQFLVSTRPDVAPQLIAQRVKGRLQHLIRESRPTAFRRNYSLRSIGSETRETLEGYLASQLGHHPCADSRVTEQLQEMQLHNPAVDLSQPSHTSHAIYWFNLHVVLVNDGRYREVHNERLRAVRDMILSASQAKGHQLSRAAILPDHIHLTMRCGLDESPQSVALSYLNNLAFAQGMKCVFQFGYFVGTFGEYDLGAIPRDVSSSDVAGDVEGESKPHLA